MPRFRSLPALAALCLASLAACGGAPEGGERIVLITLDTLRWDAFSGADGHQAAMPRLAEWAQHGAVFDRYYSATSTTQPSHATLFTGLHPWQHGVPFNGAMLPDEHNTVVEQLRDAGFYTAAVIASFPVHSQFGWNQGFHEFRDDFTQGQVDLWSGVEVEAEGFHSEAGHIVDQALELLDGAQGSKQFFWFHMYDPHAPYGDSGKGKTNLNPRDISRLVKDGEAADAVTARARRAYDRDVKYMDKELARLLERLAADTRFETHVVIVSDHGESFGEGGSLGHGKRLTPEQIHVPLIVSSPRVAPGVHSEPVGTIDVAATLLSLGGIHELPTGSRDLTADVLEELPVFGMRRTYNERYIESRTDGKNVFIEPEHRRFYTVDGGLLYVGGTGGVSIDDSEVPLADQAAASKYQAVFDAFAESFNAVGFKRTDDEATLQTLRDLGYTD